MGDPACPCAPHARATAPARSPATAPFPPPCPSHRQIAAWKAGHKHECGAPGQGGAVAKLRSAARADAARAEAARAPAGLTVEQNRLGMRLSELAANIGIDHEIYILAD